MSSILFFRTVRFASVCQKEVNIRLRSSCRLRFFKASHSFRSSQIPLHPSQWSIVKVSPRPTRNLIMRKRHSGQSIGKPGSANDKFSVCSTRSASSEPCCSTHFQYSAPLSQLPPQSGQVREIRFSSSWVVESSVVLQNGHFMW